MRPGLEKDKALKGPLLVRLIHYPKRLFVFKEMKSFAGSKITLHLCLDGATIGSEITLERVRWWRNGEMGLGSGFGELGSGFGEASAAVVLRMLDSEEYVSICSKLSGSVIGISDSRM